VPFPIGFADIDLRSCMICEAAALAFSIHFNFVTGFDIDMAFMMHLCVLVMPSEEAARLRTGCDAAIPPFADRITDSRCVWAKDAGV
jgi:hypothetical protein